MKEYYSYLQLGKVNGPGCNVKEEFYVNDESTIIESVAIPKQIPGMKDPIAIKESILGLSKSGENSSKIEGVSDVVVEAEESAEMVDTPVVNESTNITNVNVSSSYPVYRSVGRYLYSPVIWFGRLVGIKELDRPQLKFSALIFLVLFAILITMLVRKN
jgi:hypothetical protein